MPSKNSFRKFILVAAFCSAPMFAGCSKTSDSAGVQSAGNSTEATAPMQPFFLSLMKSGGQFGGRVAIPAIWIFSADGKLVQLVTSDEELAGLQQNSSSGNTAASGLTCEQVDAAVKEAAPAQAWRFDCGNGQPSALLITNREVCKTCDAFEAKFATLADIAPEHRQTLALTQ
ncbi:hypothetical protein LU699_13100 [Luteimonas fraxinea]|uniref:Lipoprotein n=1 Tax=Luteimonas fraxinea TaxID=2901869 RepID=A0ABS8UFM3_9GAMM|nr:hypothetical protein [Luteimonas fraxinea]MCD9098049.1 hypothetical protein [Luteimonas fraxinea]UHH09226.1 hypothetical protein LU699_13100 [Luteimonas fraxinea]